MKTCETTVVSPPRSSSRLFIELFGGAIISFVVAIISIKFVPYLDDEYIVYHGISCFIREDIYSPIRDRCLPLSLPWFLGDIVGRVYFLSYEYVGWIQGLIFWPLAQILPYHSFGRAYVFFGLFIVSFLSSRAYSISCLGLFCTLVFFAPWSFQHLFDTGQIFAQLPNLVLSLCWVKLLFERKVYSKHFSLFSLTVGIALFLGLWARLSFVFVFPGLLFASLSFFMLGKIKGLANQKIFLQFSILVVPFISLSALLLMAKFSNGRPYYSIFSAGASSKYLFNLSAQFSNFINRFSHFFVTPADAAQDSNRAIGVGSSLTGFLYLLLFFALLNLFFRGNRSSRIRALIFLCSGFITVMTINSSQMSWSMHHLVLSFPFILFGFLELWKSAREHRAAKIIVVLSCLSFTCVWIDILNFNRFPRPSRDSVVPRLLQVVGTLVTQDSFVFVSGWGACFGAKAMLPHDVAITCEEEAFRRKYLEKYKSEFLGSKRHVIFLMTHKMPELLYSDLRALFPQGVEHRNVTDGTEWALVELNRPVL